MSGYLTALKRRNQLFGEFVLSLEQLEDGEVFSAHEIMLLYTELSKAEEQLADLRKKESYTGGLSLVCDIKLQGLRVRNGYVTGELDKFLPKCQAWCLPDKGGDCTLYELRSYLMSREALG